MIRLQTLYHADKEKAELYILELAIWLHRLVTMVKQRIHAFPPLPIRSAIHEGKKFHSKVQPLTSRGRSTGTASPWAELSRQGKLPSEEVLQRKLTFMKKQDKGSVCQNVFNVAN